MQSPDVTPRQLGAWMVAALSAPLAQIAGGTPWQQITLLAVACLGLCWVVNRQAAETGKLLALVESLWIICVLGSVMRWMAPAWPSGNVYPAVQLILLALAAASACKGTESSARAGSLLYWLLALIYAVVIVAGAGEVEAVNLTAATAQTDVRLVTVLLIPALAGFIPVCRKKLTLCGLVKIGGFSLLVPVVVIGALSLPLAAQWENPLYEWVRGLSLLETVERFEAVVAVGLTMGWFALLNFVLCAVGHLAEEVRPGGYRCGIWTGAVLAALTTAGEGWLSDGTVAALCIAAWVAVPIFRMGCRKNKSEIFKNSA